MASAAMHLEQAEYNKDYATDVITQTPVKYKDWAVIGAFYSALHYIEGYLAAKHNIHSEAEYKKARKNSPHLYRLDYVAISFPDDIAISYTELYHASMQLRYLTDTGPLGTATTRGDFISDAQAQNFVENKLGIIEKNFTKPIQSSIA